MVFEKNDLVMTSYMKGRALASYEYKAKFYAHFLDGKHFCFVKQEKDSHETIHVDIVYCFLFPYSKN